MSSFQFRSIYNKQHYMKLTDMVKPKRPRIKMIITEEQAKRLTDRLINETQTKMNIKLISN